MKRHLLKFLLPLALVLISGNAWGDIFTTTFTSSDFTGQGTSGTGSNVSTTKEDVTVSTTKGYGTDQFRVYSGAKLTISSVSKIKKIVFTFSETSYSGGLNASYDDLNTQSWESSLTSQARLTKIVVTYEKVSVADVSLNKNSLSLPVGRSETLVATISPADATNKNVSWVSSNPSVATVADGVVTAVAEGNATITVTSVEGSKTAICDVNVTEAIDQSVTYTFTSGSWGDETSSWTSNKAGGTDSKGVQVTSSNTGANATSKDTFGNVSKVVVKYCTNASNGAGKIIIKVGEGTAKEFTVTSSGGTTLRNTDEFIFSPLETGKVNITVNCTTNSIYIKEITITYETLLVEVENVSLNASAISLAQGRTSTLVATFTPENASNKNVTWESSDPSIATVDNNGVVTGVAIGTATVTAKSEDGNKTAECLVTVVESTTYAIGVADVSNGTVSIDPSSKVAYPGDLVTVTVEPAFGYELNTLTALKGSDAVSFNETIVPVTSSTDYSFIMPDGDVTVQASFVKERISDVLTVSWTGVTQYSDWEKTGVTTKISYKGNTSKNNNAIQMRGSDLSGIVTTTSCGLIRNIVVSWSASTTNGRYLDVYGKNTPYNGPSDLYDNSQGTLLGSLQNGETELVIPGDYKYIGLRSRSGAMYLNEIKVSWEQTAQIVSVSNKQWATASFKRNVVVPAANTAVYVVTGVANGNVEMTALAENDIIAAGVGVLVNKEVAGDVIFNFTTNNANVLSSALATSGSISTADYILGTYGADGFGFCHPSTTITCENGKAFLPASVVSGTPAPFLRIGGTTNVNYLQNDLENNVYYDLMGRKVEQPAKGIYILNGKKVLFK